MRAASFLEWRDYTPGARHSVLEHLALRLTYNFFVAQKTNAARLLDQLRIHYELREYEVDLEDLAAETVAAKIGLPAEQVFKTLVGAR